MREVVKKRYRVLCSFGGGGGGALGFQLARAKLFGVEASFDLVGGFDKDGYACEAFKYLTGVEETCIDAREITPAMMRQFYGERSPFAIFGSAPCVGASKLLPTAKSKLPKYELLNELTLVHTRLILEAWEHDLPAFILYENVPNITSRAKGMLAEVRRLLKAAGYVLQDGFHECRHVGNLAQRRKRWFMVARNPKKVAAFLYLPPHRPGLVCGDVLSELPMPGAPEGGPMHVLPAISARNQWRLWKIPAGGDWRDLLPDDGTPRRARFRRHHIQIWSESSSTIGGPGSNGPCAIADPRDAGGGLSDLNHESRWYDGTELVVDSTSAAINALWSDLGSRAEGQTSWFNGSYSVMAWDGPSRSVIGSRWNGASYVADPRPFSRFHHVERVTRWCDAAGSVTHSPAPSSGAIAVADPRFPGSLGVLSLHEPADSVTGEAYPSTGRFSLADDLRRYEGYEGVLGVLSSGEPAPCVTGNAGPTTSRFSYADDPSRHRHVLGVLSPNQPAFVITGQGKPTSGAFSYADANSVLDMKISPDAPANHYQVVAFTDPCPTITTATRPGNGAPSYAEPLDLRAQAENENMHYGKYIVRSWDEEAKTVTGAARVGSGAQSIAQPLQTRGFRWIWGVLDPREPSGTITANSRIATGANAIAAPVPLVLLPQARCFPKGYGVIDRDKEPSNAIAATSSVGCGTYAIADRIPITLTLQCSPRAGAYGVIDAQTAAPTIIASAKIDNTTVAIAAPKPPSPPFVVLSYEEACKVADGLVSAPFAIVDPARPEDPLAIVDDMGKPPFRWVETQTKSGRVQRRKEVVPLVLISEDGTWHRPLTTLELAVLQGLPWKHNDRALDFGEGSTKQRTLIGNMVPRPVGTAIAEQMLLAGIAADQGSFFLTNGGSGIWVERKHRRRLEQMGIRSVRQEDAVRVPAGVPVILDDSALPLEEVFAEPAFAIDLDQLVVGDRTVAH